MSRHEVECFFSNEGTRNEVRMRVVDRLALEEAGTGKDENASRYIYYVETLADGNRVYLQRPANLHNGFDFLVCVENINYAVAGKRRRNYPKHQDFGEDLEAKKLKNPEMYKKLYKLLEKVYLCHDITVVRHINLGSIRHFKLVENNIKQFTQHINLCFFCALF